MLMFFQLYKTLQICRRLYDSVAKRIKQQTANRWFAGSKPGRGFKSPINQTPFQLELSNTLTSIQLQKICQNFLRELIRRKETKQRLTLLFFAFNHFQSNNSLIKKQPTDFDLVTVNILLVTKKMKLKTVMHYFKHFKRVFHR